MFVATDPPGGFRRRGDLVRFPLTRYERGSKYILHVLPERFAADKRPCRGRLTVWACRSDKTRPRLVAASVRCRKRGVLQQNVLRSAAVQRAYEPVFARLRAPGSFLPVAAAAPDNDCATSAFYDAGGKERPMHAVVRKSRVAAARPPVRP